MDECRRTHTYVMAHVYTDEAIRRCAALGVRSIEHGNFLEDGTARLMAERHAYLVPTLVTYRALVENASRLGLSAEERGKIDEVVSTGTRSLEVAKRAGVKMAYGTDCFRSGTEYQSREFLVRAEVLSPAEIIRSATLACAELLRMEGEIGVIAPGAFADLLAVDGNPLEDLGLFQDDGAHLSLIMKEGQVYKDLLSG